MTEKKLTFKTITKFVYPSILLMMFLSIYTAVDGIFIARFVTPLALGGQSIVLPLFTVASAVGIMFATGGGAIIAMQLGKKEVDSASRNFTSLITIGTLFGIVATIVCLVFQDNILTMLGLKGQLWEYGSTYSFYLILSFPFLIIKLLYESLLRVDGSPSAALKMTILGGVLNIIFDYIFMVPFKMGITGAGLGTLIGIALSDVVGFYYFMSKKSLMKFQFHMPDSRFMLKTITNGSSEMVNEMALALMTYIYNMLALKYIGEIGVSAITIIMGVNFLIVSVSFGFSMGVAPLISYNYGAKNEENVAKVMRYSKYFLLVTSLISVAVGVFAAGPLVGIYASRSEAVYPIAVHGLKLSSISFLFSGLNIYGSAFFTAFGNGKISAFISFIKSFGFFVMAAMILPYFMQANGIWFIKPIAEFLSVFMVVLFMIKYQKKYRYDVGHLFYLNDKKNWEH